MELSGSAETVGRNREHCFRSRLKFLIDYYFYWSDNPTTPSLPPQIGYTDKLGNKILKRISAELHGLSNKSRHF